MTTPSKPTHDLEQIQRWMQATIMHPANVVEGVVAADTRRHIDVGLDDVEQVVTRSQALTALERLAIYGYAYRARLVECLREEYSVLRHALGEEAFDAFAIDYLRMYPSRSYTLSQLGANFPRFLAETRPAESGGEGLPADWPDFLIDLTTLERTFNEVFDGPGVEGERLLDPDQLAAMRPERLLDARLVGVSCLRLLRLRYPVHRYFTAVRRKQKPAPPRPAQTYLAVTRRRYVVRHYELSFPAHQILQALLAGESVGEAIGRAVETAGPDLDRLSNNLRTWFRDWAAEGFFASIEPA
ncbi:MAG TPA: DNA-binding domain-containing protein [Pirellulales bacterium]|nr:DNA-binding domain-containing protein [Pirellulales bacterium]